MKMLNYWTIVISFLLATMSLGAQDVHVLGSDNNELPRKVLRTSQGDYLFYGEITGTKRNSFIFRTDDNLNAYDHRIFELPDVGFVIYDVQELPSGDFNVVGARSMSATRLSAVTAQLDASLNVIWVKEHKNTSFSTELYSIVNMPDDGFVAVGRRTGATGTAQSVDILATRFNNTGDIVWTTRAGETGTVDSDWAGEVVLDVNGDIVLSAATYSTGNGGANHDSYFLRLEAATGAIKDHGGFATARNGSNSIIAQLADSSFIFVANTSSNSSGANADLVVAKIKGDFTLDYERHYDVNSVTNGPGEFFIENDILYMVGSATGRAVLMKFDVNNGDELGSFFIDEAGAESRPFLSTDGTDMIFGCATTSYSVSGATGQNELLLSKFPLGFDTLECIFQPAIITEATHSLGNDYALTGLVESTYTMVTEELELITSGFEQDTIALCAAAPLCTYAIASDTAYCSESPTVCIPLLAVNPVADGIIGLDFCLDYDDSLLTPTGMITIGDVVLDGSVFADYYINTTTTDPGKLYVSIYYTTMAPAGTNFIGDGEVACVEFTLNGNYTVGTTTPIDVCEIQESYELSVEPACAESGDFTLLDDTTLEGRITFWDDDLRPLRYDMNNPTDYLVTSIDGRNDGCEPLPSPITNPDLMGNFEFDIAIGTHIRLDRDIDGGNTGGSCPVDVMPTINGMDCYWVGLVTTNDNTFSPNPFQIVSMDVNMDDQVSAGDITHIQNRIVQNICEFPQAWNYPNPSVASKDWRFVDNNIIADQTDFTISATYPVNDNTGYSRYDVPNVPECLEIKVTNTDNCTYIDSTNYYGILLGDADGTWDGNTTPVLLRQTDKTIFDLDAVTADPTDCTIRIPVSFESLNSYRAIDFNMDYDESELEFVSIEYAAITPQEASVAWNNQNEERLLFTSYAKVTGGLPQTSAPLFYLVFRLKNNEITNTELGQITSYFNGTESITAINGSTANCTAVGINPEPVASNISIYPTVFSDVITIDLSAKAGGAEQIFLFDVQGRMLQNLNNVQGEIRLETADLAAGVYLIKVDGTTRKVVKH